MATIVTIRCLGEIRFGVEPRLRRPPAPRAADLLALIATEARPVSRQRVASLLWPEVENTTARGNVRRHLHALRRAVDAAEWLIDDGDGLAFASTTFVDIRELNAAIAANDATRVFELYDDDFFTAADVPWAIAVRERLRDDASRSLARAVRTLRIDGYLDRALPLAQKAVAIDPLREEYVRALATILYELGDKSAALHALDRYATRLAKELDSPPSPEILSLRTTIARDDIVTDVRRARTASGEKSRDPIDFPLVGRADSLARFDAALAEAMLGDVTFVRIVGEAGIGKSRLIREFLHVHARFAPRIAIGRTSPTERYPYEAFVEMLTALTAEIRMAVEASARAILAPLVPDCARDDDPPCAPLEPTRNAARLFDAVARAFERVAARRPLVLVLEDLHGAGQATLALLASLGRRLRKGQILIVVTYRDDGDAGTIRRALPTGARTIRLRPLTTEDVETLCEHAQASVESATLARISSGNPFFLTELLRVRGDGAFAAPIATISQALAERCRALDAQTRLVLDVAATLGRGFDGEHVGLVTGLPMPRIEEALDSLVRIRVVREAERSSSSEFFFTHELVRDHIYAMIEPETRRRWHARIARFLEATTTTEDRGHVGASIARHYAAAGLGDRAAIFELEAARHALRLFAHADAREHATRALASHAEGADVERRSLDALLIREQASAALGDRARQAIDLATARRLPNGATNFTVWSRVVSLEHARADRIAEVHAVRRLEELAQSAVERIRARVARARLDLATGDYRGCDGALVDALALIATMPDLDSRHLVVEALCLRARGASERCAFDESEERLAAAHAAATGDAPLTMQVLQAAVACSAVRRRYDEIVRDGLTLRRLAAAIDDRVGEAHANVTLAGAFAGLGRLEDAAHAYESAERLFTVTGSERERAMLDVNRVIFHSRRCDHRSALACARRAGDWFERNGEEFAMTTARLNEAMMLLVLGRSRVAAERATNARCSVVAAGDRRFEAVAATILGACKLVRGETQEAIAELSIAISSWDRLADPAGKPEAVALRAIALTWLGNIRAAVDDDDFLATLDADTIAQVDMPQLIATGRFAVALARGDRDRAADHIHAAAFAIDDAVRRAASAEIAARYRRLPLNTFIARSAGGLQRVEIGSDTRTLFGRSSDSIEASFPFSH